MRLVLMIFLEGSDYAFSQSNELFIRLLRQSFHSSPNYIEEANNQEQVTFARGVMSLSCNL